MASGSWQPCQRWCASRSSWDEHKCKEVEYDMNHFTKIERRETILDVKIGGKFSPVCQEPTWKETEEKMTGLVFKLEGKLRSAVTGKLTSDNLSEYGERSGRRRVHCDERLGVRRFDHFFPMIYGELHQDKQRHLETSLVLPRQRKRAKSVRRH